MSVTGDTWCGCGRRAHRHRQRQERPLPPSLFAPVLAGQQERPGAGTLKHRKASVRDVPVPDDEQPPWRAHARTGPLLQPGAHASRRAERGSMSSTHGSCACRCSSRRNAPAISDSSRSRSMPSSCTSPPIVVSWWRPKHDRSPEHRTDVSGCGTRAATNQGEPSQDPAPGRQTPDLMRHSSSPT